MAETKKTEAGIIQLCEEVNPSYKVCKYCWKRNWCMYNDFNYGDSGVVVAFAMAGMLCLILFLSLMFL